MAELTLARPVLLSKDHRTSEFDCGTPALHEFLARHALSNQAGGGARTYVACRDLEVAGYYSLAPASVSPDDAPERVVKGQGRYGVPVILMARLAVDRREQGKGLGSALLRDALLRALQGAEVMGGRAFLVHAKDDAARRFYAQFGMEESPTHRLHLYLLLKDVRRSIAPP